MPINRAPGWRVQEGCRSLITVQCNTHSFVQGWGGAAQLLLPGWWLHQPYTPFIVPRHADPGQWHSLTRYLAFWDRDRELIHLAVLTLVWQGSSYSCKTSTRPLQQLYKQGAVKIKIKEFTFAILTTPIAQGYSQIHGIVASVCFNGWISTTFYVK